MENYVIEMQSKCWFLKRKGVTLGEKLSCCPCRSWFSCSYFLGTHYCTQRTCGYFFPKIHTHFFFSRFISNLLFGEVLSFCPEIFKGCIRSFKDGLISAKRNREMPSCFARWSMWFHQQVQCMYIFHPLP